MTTPIPRVLRAVTGPIGRLLRRLTKTDREACEATHTRKTRRTRFNDIQDTVCGCWRLCIDCREEHESWCAHCVDEANEHEDLRDVAADRIDEVA